MELEFDVKINSSDLYDYLLYHTYTGFSGMLGTLAGVFLVMAFLGTRYFIYLIAGIVLIVYMPCSLFLKAKQQAVNNPVFKEPLAQSWENCVKAVSTARSIILYTSRTTASIFPKRDLGEKKEALIQMISTHMPPKKVKIRF